MLTLNVNLRDKNTKIEDLRLSGLIPAVYYGKAETSTSITIVRTDFIKVWREAGESAVVTLLLPDGPKDSLIHEVDLDPVSGVPRHVDFYVFEKGHKVTVSIPLEFIGTSRAIKDFGGTLVQVMHELKVEAVPKDLPQSIPVELSSLVNFGDQILAKSISLPAGVQLRVSDDEVVATVSAPRNEKEEDVTTFDLSSIEVEKKGKEDVSEDTENS